jgi:hypothetical protein
MDFRILGPLEVREREELGMTALTERFARL